MGRDSNTIIGSSTWSPGSWESKRALQIPRYPDEQELHAVLRTVETFPQLVLPEEARELERRLADAAAGKAFLLQGGDCAESFKEFGMDKVRATYDVLLKMGAVLAFGGQMPVIKVGRMAGQFAKPRSTAVETRDGVTLPIYQGDIVNSLTFGEKARAPDPQRLLRAYSQSASTMNLLRSFTAGGHPSVHRLSQWNLDFVQPNEQGARYLELARAVDEALGFVEAAGAGRRVATEFWTSHECLLLHYEQAQTRLDPATGLYYVGSGHMLWVGERTRQLDGAHVEFLRGVANPLGVKVSEGMDPSELVRLCEILNPHNKPGRVTVITRMGAEGLRRKLPLLIRAVSDAGTVVTWVCDPVHANAIKAPCGSRTRTFDAIKSELKAFLEVHEEEGSHPGGIHLEMTGQDVTECVGGSKEVTFEDLGKRYLTHCDPRLNASQSLELAFMVAEWLRQTRLGSQRKDVSNGHPNYAHAFF